jgi:hypothetical protein
MSVLFMEPKAGEGSGGWKRRISVYTNILKLGEEAF